MMSRLGYEPDGMFNTLNGASRLYYVDRANSRHVDVFVDAVRMCHTIDFRDRLELFPDTLTPTDLLLSKLQIIEVNHKDVLDLAALLHDQRLEANANAAIDTAHLELVWGNDWPLWRTCQLTLGRTRHQVQSIIGGSLLDRVESTIEALDRLLVQGQKSLRWRLRARVGDRVRWYELPEELGG
jgi:hypothetical protein